MHYIMFSEVQISLKDIALYFNAYINTIDKEMQ